MKRYWPSLCLTLGLAFPLGAQDRANPNGAGAVTAPAPKTLSAARLSNAAAIRRQLNLLPAYERVASLESVKVAVLDYGFEGVGSDRPYLPANTVVVEHYDPDFVRRFKLGSPSFQKPFAPGNSHGRVMAQLVWAVTGSKSDGPRFYLLNANGPTLFRRAVRYAIEQKIDIILFAGNFEGAGNYDGRGPINAVVDEAVAAGIIWVNAAGNYGGSVYNGAVQPTPSGYLRLGSEPSATGLRLRNLLDENAVTVTLTWNDYRDEEDAGTDKDLDLYVEDGRGRVVGSSELRQVSGGRPAAEGESRNPRERVVLSDVPAAPGSDYRIRVKARSDNFSGKDRLRILVTALRDTPFRDPQSGKLVRPVQLLESSESGEVYAPADHPGVITVGDASRYSSIGPTSDGRVKPDVVLEDATALFSNGEESNGSSNAAAYFTGVVALLKAGQPGLKTRHILTLARRGEGPSTAAPRTRVETLPPPQPLPAAPRTRVETLPPPQPLPAATVSPYSAAVVLRGMPLTENQQRALRHAESAAGESLARGEPNGVWLSLRAGGVPLYQGPVTVPQRAAPAPSAGEGRVSGVGGTGQDSRSHTPPAQPIITRQPPPRPPWRTPSPERVAEVVRASP